jgi:hypothetical protein
LNELAVILHSSGGYMVIMTLYCWHVNTN